MQIELMGPLNWIFMIGDYAVAAILVLYFIWAYRKNKIPKSYWYAFGIGCLIGAVWEFAFLFLGPDFLHAAIEWPWGLSGWPKKISHSIWDGGVFMAGVLFCTKILGPDSRFINWNWKEYLIMALWGIGQELFVEYIFAGRVWVYSPLPWNPIIIPPLPGMVSDVGMTFWPQAVWILAPIVFYFIFLRLEHKYRVMSTLIE